MSDERTSPPGHALAHIPATVTLPVKSVRVVPEPFGRSPGNEPVDIVEIELAPVNDGNFAWHAWQGPVYVRVEREHAESLLAQLGVKP